MHFTDPKVWTDGLRAVMDAPHIVGPLMVMVAVFVWWFRGLIARRRIAALEERLRLARDKDADVTSGLEAAQGIVLALDNQVGGYEQRAVIFETSAAAVTMMGRTIAANAELGKILRGEKKK
jgi:hypothetical protein